MIETTSPVRRSIRIKLADRPGSFADVARIVAEDGVNLVRFEVVSHDGDQVWDDLELETTEGTSLASVVRSLRGAGYEVVGLPRNWTIRDWALGVVAVMSDLTELADATAIQRRLFEGIRTLARTDHGFLLFDDPQGDASDARDRWEALESASTDVDPETVVWSGDGPAIEIARTALVAVGTQPRKASRSRFGGAAFLLGGTPRRGVVVAVGGRPPFLPAEVERSRRFVRMISPWVGPLRPAVAG